MIVVPVAHAGHWLADLLYAVPVLLVAIALGIQTLRDRSKARKKEQEIAARRRNL